MGNKMKTSIKVIEGLVKKYPNDQQLGSVVRHFILELQSHRRKREKITISIIHHNSCINIYISS